MCGVSTTRRSSRSERSTGSGSASNRRDQRRLVDDWAARGVDQYRGRVTPAQLFVVPGEMSRGTKQEPGPPAVPADQPDEVSRVRM
jgi:hypothetical protein